MKDMTEFKRKSLYFLLTIILVFPCLLGPFVAYTWILCAGILFLVLVACRKLVLDAVGLTFLLAFLATGATYALSAQSPAHMVYVLNFVAFGLFSSQYTVSVAAARDGASTLFSILALFGVIIAATIAVIDATVFDASRAGYIVSDPIRLPHTALLLASFALLGLRLVEGRKNLLFLIVVPLTMLAIYLAGARTAFIASIVTFSVSALLLPRGRWKALSAAMLALLGGGLALLLLSGMLPGRLNTLGEIFTQIQTGQAIADDSFAIRLELYKAAIPAFWDAPLFGHGWAGFMQALEPYLPEVYRQQIGLPHVHNDLLNFALTSGVFGIVVYLSLLVVPFYALYRSPRDGQFFSRAYLITMLVIGYIVMGLTDTMLAYETHTTLYVAYCAAILGFCRDTPIGVVREKTA